MLDKDLINKIAKHDYATLNYEDVKISARQLELIFQATIENPFINQLIFKNCDLDDSHCAAIVNFIKSNSKVGELDMSHNKLSDVSIKRICDALYDDKAILEINFSDNPNITDESLIYFARLLQINNNLAALSIGNISRANRVIIPESFVKNNNSLIYFISLNREEERAIGKKSNNNHTIWSNLASCLYDDDVVKIQEILKTRPDIKSHIQLYGASPIVLLLSDNGGRYKLNINDAQDYQIKLTQIAYNIDEQARLLSDMKSQVGTKRVFEASVSSTSSLATPEITVKGLPIKKRYLLKA